MWSTMGSMYGDRGGRGDGPSRCFTVCRGSNEVGATCAQQFFSRAPEIPAAGQSAVLPSSARRRTSGKARQHLHNGAPPLGWSHFSKVGWHHDGTSPDAKATDEPSHHQPTASPNIVAVGAVRCQFLLLVVTGIITQPPAHCKPSNDTAPTYATYAYTVPLDVAMMSGPSAVKTLLSAMAGRRP